MFLDKVQVLSIQRTYCIFGCEMVEMVEKNGSILVLDGKMIEMMQEAAESLGIDVEELAKMAIFTCLNSPMVTSSLTPTPTVSQKVEDALDLGSPPPEPLVNLKISGTERVTGADKVLGRSPELWEGVRATDIEFDRIRVGKAPAPEDEYILWGQFSRFLTIKYSLRILANISALHDGAVPLETWFDMVRSHASKARSVLREIDVVQKIPRGSQFASGFPKGGEKSLDRFVNHFCAAIYSDGTVVGFPSHLGLILVTDARGDEPVVELTEEGLEYVGLHNPILDGSAPFDSAMSEEESDFMLGRIEAHLPSTWGFFQYVLSSINGGADTPLALSEAIERAYGGGSSKNWNDAQVATYRAGAIGLLGDLGLVERTWNFRNVTYSLAQSAEGVMSQ
mgnify:CR=1 FL=1